MGPSPAVDESSCFWAAVILVYVMYACGTYSRAPIAKPCSHTLFFCHPQRATQASTKRMLETSSVQNALRIVTAMEKGLRSATARRASSGLRKILQLWLVHVSITANHAWYFLIPIKTTDAGLLVVFFDAVRGELVLPSLITSLIWTWVCLPVRVSYWFVSKSSGSLL